MSGCRVRRILENRLDVGEGAAGVPGGEASDEPRGAVELDTSVAGGFGPGELACVPFDEGFGVRGDVEVLVEAGVLLADLGLSVLDQQPEPFAGPAGGEVEADDDAVCQETDAGSTREASRTSSPGGTDTRRTAGARKCSAIPPSAVMPRARWPCVGQRLYAPR
jgi:hypothetical protein